MYLQKLKLLFKYGPELETLLEDLKRKKEQEEFESKAKILNLCYAHRQEEYHSHYSTHNCDYCKLEARVIELEQALTNSVNK